MTPRDIEQALLELYWLRRDGIISKEEESLAIDLLLKGTCTTTSAAAHVAVSEIAAKVAYR